MTEFNKMQLMKRRFFAMRNGVIADTMRRGGSKFRIIFGLNLPQLVDIAREFGHDATLARELWANASTRESRLLAPMLLRPDDLSNDEIRAMIDDIDDVELADVFCHRFLRHVGSAWDIAGELAELESEMHRYIALRLAMNLVYGNPAAAKAIAERPWVSSSPRLAALSRQILEEVEFLGN